MNHLPLHIFTAVHAEAKAVRKVLPAQCQLHVIGIRAVHLPKTLAPCRGIIMAGFGGALDPTLVIGDIVIDAPEGLLPPTHQHLGRIHTADHIVATPAEKTALFTKTRAVAVDMELAHVRPLAERLGVPLVGIRAISDRADHALDPTLLSFLDERGNVRPGALISHLFQRPATIPQLIRLGLHAKTASKRLTGAIVSLISDLATATGHQTLRSPG